MKKESIVAKVLIAVILGYQRVVSPIVVAIFGARCRFIPSCSAYAADSIRKYGIARGLVRSLGRLIRCHPFCRGGHDPA